MSADRVDDRVIEMARVTQEASGNVIGMFETLKDIFCDGELRALSKLCSHILFRGVDALHPAMVVGGSCLSHMLLENDDVGVGDLDRVGGREDGSDALVDGLGAEGRGSWCR